ncbi:MAG: NUDIX hydrolase [Rhodospirillales bacterium]|nr:NUDIX hydrolase [Rhodospirillales bacterium]
MAKNPVPDWFFSQSAVIPFRSGADGLEILLITTRKRKGWIVPKGVIEPELSPEESALAEAAEEAGIKGRIVGDALGSYDYDKWGGTCSVLVFAMAVEQILDDWPERNMRDRQWLPAAEAADLVKKREVGDLIRALAARLRDSG